MKLQDGAKYIHNLNGIEFTLVEDYNGRWYLENWSDEGLKKTLSATGEEMVDALKKHYVKANDFTDEEKLSKYDEIHSWYLWLKRRTHDGKVDKSHVETFLKGLKQEIEGVDVNVK
ncbi:hypothetical protein NXG04_07760 [Klebsiella pneumoniae]|nr:hypothetical protein [Klebsiella pneumoniae]MDS7714450.1 hypothetical protein [Klebsiella pneumoniae]